MLSACVFFALAMCVARAEYLFDEYGNIMHPKEVKPLPHLGAHGSYARMHATDRFRAEMKHYFPSYEELETMKAERSQKFMDNALRRISKDLEPDELVVVNIMALFSVAGMALTFFCACGCCITCCCGQETCQSIYHPCVRCTVKSCCWPAFCIASACSMCRKQFRKIRVKRRRE